ncbi:hypothetical protein NA57DRAFT_53349 [Rhizodiscina lignyota]|uniref:Uncharacterized protein n=1 Tax=Rhizodiscina lignyota TaxID=1504668 RepID=A0A9P4ILB5_9PEZI|nr:hypothetical protein NA57DRAFT_53349 [Rhizodiscina lignyota]
MSSNHHQQGLPFLTKPQPQQQPPKDADLPQGECTFLKPQVGRSPLRCDCVAFTLDKDRPGAICGCGHAAWTHVREHVGDGVSRDEFAHLVREMREIKGAVRDMHEELNRQRSQREKENQQIVDEFRKLFDTITKVKMLGESRMVASHAGLEQRIASVSSHATHLEDRIEAIVDKTQNWDRVVRKLEVLDEACMSLEDRVDKVDNKQSHPPDLSPVQEVNSNVASPTPTAAPLEQTEQVEKRPAADWEIHVVLVPKRTQRYAFAHDSVEWRRCYSRGLHQTISPASRSAEDFSRAVESAFKPILQNRPWTPLVCLSSQDKELSQLPPGQNQPHLWDYTFLEKHCFAHDKLDGDIVYIAPTQEELPWSFIRSLTRAPNADETCWEHNVSLDGFGVNFSRPQTARSPFQSSNTPFARPSQSAPLGQIDSRMMDFIKNESSPAWVRKSSLESDSNSMYENSPPPYSTRTSTSGGTYAPSGMDNRLVDSGLNILAITALGQSGNEKPGAIHPFDPRSLTQRPSSSAGPGERSLTVPPQMPMGNEMDIDDEGGNHDSRGKSSEPSSLHRSGSNSTSNSRETQAPQQQQFYFTGRSKRRVTTGKYKEPVELSISSVKLPRLGFHKHSSDEKGKDREEAENGPVA